MQPWFNDNCSSHLSKYYLGFGNKNSGVEIQGVLTHLLDKLLIHVEITDSFVEKCKQLGWTEGYSYDLLVKLIDNIELRDNKNTTLAIFPMVFWDNTGEENKTIDYIYKKKNIYLTIPVEQFPAFIFPTLMVHINYKRGDGDIFNNNDYKTNVILHYFSMDNPVLIYKYKEKSSFIYSFYSLISTSSKLIRYHHYTVSVPIIIKQTEIVAMQFTDSFFNDFENDIEKICFINGASNIFVEYNFEYLRWLGRDNGIWTFTNKLQGQSIYELNIVVKSLDAIMKIKKYWKEHSMFNIYVVTLAELNVVDSQYYLKNGFTNVVIKSRKNLYDADLFINSVNFTCENVECGITGLTEGDFVKSLCCRQWLCYTFFKDMVDAGFKKSSSYKVICPFCRCDPVKFDLYHVKKMNK